MWERGAEAIFFTFSTQSHREDSLLSLLLSSVHFNILGPSLEKPGKLKCLKNKITVCLKATGDTFCQLQLENAFAGLQRLRIYNYPGLFK